MWPDWVSNPGPLTYESGALPLRYAARLVEWLERLGYGAESHLRDWASPCDDWKTLSVIPAVNGYLFQIREG